MYSCSSTLSQILLKNSLGKVVFQILVTFAKRKFVFWPLFWNKTFVWSFFLLIYGCFGCIPIWCKLRYRNSYRKVLKNEWVQVDPSPRFFAQTGVKSSFSFKLNPNKMISPISCALPHTDRYLPNLISKLMHFPTLRAPHCHLPPPKKKKKKWDSLPHKSNIILSFRNNTVSERFGIVLLWNVSEK